MVFDDLAERAPGDVSWCADVDLMVDDARAAIGWAADRGERAEPRRWPCASPRSRSSGAGPGRPSSATSRRPTSPTTSRRATRRSSSPPRAALARWVGTEAVAAS